jgi:hypothetical protein
LHLSKPASLPKGTDGYRQTLEGLQPGELVATEGALFLEFNGMKGVSLSCFRYFWGAWLLLASLEVETVQ